MSAAFLPLGVPKSEDKPGEGRTDPAMPDSEPAPAEAGSTAPEAARYPVPCHHPEYLFRPSQSPSQQQQHQQQQSSPAHVWYCVPFWRICSICLAMPLVGLVACVVVAVSFQFKDIQETHCQVLNFVPSISAVTGISPGRYLWRMAIAFHLGPRILVGSTYYQYLVQAFPPLVSQGHEWRARLLIGLLHIIYFLQIVEIIGLCLISFIHNREHYPLHEKGFLLYLSSSHLSFLLTLCLYWLVWPGLSPAQRASFRRKRDSFVISVSGLALMAFFYYRHYVFCDNFAFSMFAFVEYIVVSANMYYYWSVVTELPSEDIVVVKAAALPADAADACAAETNGKAKAE